MEIVGGAVGLVIVFALLMVAVAWFLFPILVCIRLTKILAATNDVALELKKVMEHSQNTAFYTGRIVDLMQPTNQPTPQEIQAPESHTEPAP